MRNVLLISYFFPPDHGPDILRAAQFAKHLPEFGWQPIVLARDAARNERAPEGITSAVEIYRAKSFEPFRTEGSDRDVIPSSRIKRVLTQCVQGSFFIPDLSIGWYPYALPKAMEICERETIDAICSFSPPYTSAVIARELHRRTGIPWIADFRDSWTGSPVALRRWGFPRRVDRYLERSVYEDANLVVCAWRDVMKDFQDRNPEVNPLKCLFIPDGFDNEESFPSVSRSDKKFSVMVSGKFDAQNDLSGFCNALIELRSEGRMDPDIARVMVVGPVTSAAKELIQSSGFVDAGLPTENDSHNANFVGQTDCHCLYLDPDDRRNVRGTVAAELFHSIAAGNPIIAMGDRGELVDFVRETRCGTLIARNDREALKRGLVECYEKSLYHRKKSDVDNAKIGQYERREITRRFAGLFDYLHNRR